MSYKILIVDDEAANLRVLERLFRRQYEVVTAASGAEALELLRLHDVALIISDQRMPGMTGIEFLKRAAEMRPHTVRIILTGYTDVNALVEAINSGVVYKYATKPWVNEDLQQNVVRALQHYETIKNQYELRRQNERLEARLKATRESFVRVVGDMLDLKDPHAQGHARRTRSYAAAIGEGFNLESEELEQLSLAAFLHEAANINIPSDILYKTTALTLEERRTVEQNFERGLQLLAGVPDLEEVASVIRYYHEQWDGSGYPEALIGEQIPLHARIIAVADAYDEMTTRHPLKPNWMHNEAIKRLQADAGKKFDPEVIKVFCQLKSVTQVNNMVVDEEIDLLN
ncbi:MAG TPA: HD domain-containing phosphohydrolase [Pyrinomonadaceae bacterium]|jgi:response regulator RpfG family c-di-GMP phosphodiesterase